MLVFAWKNSTKKQHSPSLYLWCVAELYVLWQIKHDLRTISGFVGEEFLFFVLVQFTLAVFFMKKKKKQVVSLSFSWEIMFGELGKHIDGLRTHTENIYYFMLLLYVRLSNICEEQLILCQLLQGDLAWLSLESIYSGCGCLYAFGKMPKTMYTFTWNI
jgi:hypothetical protein